MKKIQVWDVFTENPLGWDSEEKKLSYVQKKSPQVCNGPTTVSKLSLY